MIGLHLTAHKGGFLVVVPSPIARARIKKDHPDEGGLLGYGGGFHLCAACAITCDTKVVFLSLSQNAHTWTDGM